jgi:hypothetical protein
MKYIIREYSDLNSRVESDMAVQREQIEQEKEERLERIRRARQERGESMADAFIANGTRSGGACDETNCDIVMENPFKSISYVLVSYLSQHKDTSGFMEFQNIISSQYKTGSK